MVVYSFGSMKRYRDDRLLKEIARRMRNLREEKGISQTDFLIETGINISRIECAKRDISISHLKRICDFYGISLVELLRDIPNSIFDNDK